ncbi:MAG: hypothetical protein ABUS51_01915 [Acidobacteriota bacterium]
MTRSRFYRQTAFLAAIAVCKGDLQAKRKNQRSGSDPRQDEILVEAHIAEIQGPITRFVAIRRYDHSYIYAERGPGRGTTRIDVPDSDQPPVLTEIPYRSGSVADTVLAGADTAVVVVRDPSAVAPQAQTIRLMDFSDPDRPRITRQFEGVTAMEQLPDRGLIVLANAEGVWLLRKHLAQDPESEKRYARKVVYGESMYP